MKQTIILITALILSVTTCNAQFARGFARGIAKATKTSPKVFNKYKVPIVIGIGVGSARLQNQNARRPHIPVTGMPLPYTPAKGLLAPTIVKKKMPTKAIVPRVAVLSGDSVTSSRHASTVLPIDTVYLQRQDSTTIRTVQ